MFVCENSVQEESSLNLAELVCRPQTGCDPSMWDGHTSLCFLSPPPCYPSLSALGPGSWLCLTHCLCLGFPRSRASCQDLSTVGFSKVVGDMEMPIQIPLQRRTDCLTARAFRVRSSCREHHWAVRGHACPSWGCWHPPVHPPQSLSKTGGPFSSTGDTQDLLRAPPRQPRALLILHHILASPSVQACFCCIPFIGVDSLIKLCTPNSVSEPAFRELNQ